MRTRIFTVLAVALLTLSACKNTGPVRPSATGSRFELLIVMNNPEWQAPAGRAVFDLFNQDMEGLPQPEPVMKISQVNQANFTDVLKPARNIISIDISDRYTQSKITYSRDYYSFPQSYVRVTAPDEAAFIETINTHGDDILNYFIVTERDRTIYFNKQDLNNQAVQEVKKMFGIEIDIPVDLKRSTTATDFYWITNDNAYIRKDLVVYSYPYTDPNTFTYEFLTAKRDSVMKYHIPGEFEGSYMGTEYKYARPSFKPVAVNSEYAVEMRGLWKILNGGAMGGPFVSLTRLDEINQRIITVEGFVFAPATTKRNPLRMMEAIIYSTRLPHEINILKEVTVSASKTEVENK